MLTSRTVSDGTGNYLWTYTYTYNNGDVSLARVHDPLGNDTDHTFTSLGTHSLYETKVKYYQGAQSANQVLKTVDTAYSSNQSLSFGNMAVNVVPTSITTTWPSGKVRKTTNTYGSTFNDGIGAYLGTYGKLLTKSEYDYGTGAPGPLLRTTTYNYQFLVNANYKTYNILDLVASVQTKDGGGSQVAYTFYNYDENTPTGSGISLQHNSAPVNGTYRGNQTSVHRWLNTNGTYLVNTNSFYDTGNVYQSKDPLLNPTTFSYSPTFYGSLVTQVTNAANQSTNYNYDVNTGLPISVTDQNGHTTSYTFDALNRLTQITYPTGGGTTTLCYTDTGGTGCTQSAPPYTVVKTLQITGSLNKITSTVVDGLGRISHTQLNSDPDGVTYADITYDAVGRKATESNPYRSTSDSTYGITSYQYDGIGRLTKTIPPDGTVSANNTTTDYSVFPVIRVTDQAGHSRTSQTDALGRLTNVWEDPAGLNYETDYSYDVLGNLLTVNQKGGDSKSANWRPRTFAYDSLSRLKTAMNPESGTITYSYDADTNCTLPNSYLGLLVSKLDARGIRTCMQYDSLNRVTAKNYSDTTPVVKFGFDGQVPSGCNPVAPTLTDSNPLGYRTAMCDGSGATAWSHDALGRVLTEKRTIKGASNLTKSITYTYNLDGSLFTLTYPGTTKVITYAPGGAGRQLSAKDVAGGVDYLTSATYNPPGEIYTFANGASIAGAQTFNSRLQPKQLYFTVGAVSSLPIGQLQATACPTTAATIMSRSFNFAAGIANNGNVLSITNCLDNSRSQNFDYDHLNRVQDAYTTGANWGEAYTTDPWGNLTNIGSYLGKTNHETLNAAPASTKNQLTGFAYDAAGNMTQNGLINYTYDAESRLIWSNNGYEYLYDGDGNRVVKCTSGSQSNTCPSGSTGTLYWRIAGGDPIAESSLSGTDQEIHFLRWRSDRAAGCV